MEQNIVIALINNAALLLVLSVVYEVHYLIPPRKRYVRQIFIGLLIAGVCVTIMMIPFEIRPGVYLDARSILISVTALMFGFIPTAITVLSATVFRIFEGGAGLPLGMVIIYSSALVGLIWRRWLHPGESRRRILSLLGMSLTVHGIMLACSPFMIPGEPAQLFREIVFPIVVVFPIASVLLGILLMQLDRFRTVQRDYRSSEERYRLLFETMNQGVVFQSADGRIVSANPAAENILGMSLDQMMGRTSMDAVWDAMDEDGNPVPGDGHPAMVALKTGKPVPPTILSVFHQKRNEHVWLSITAIPLFRPGESEPYQVYATVTDITTQRLSEQRFRTLFLTMLDGFALHEIICDKNGEPMDYRFLAVNPAFERITGLKGSDIIGRTVYEVLPDTEPYWIERYGHVALTGEPVDFESESHTMDKLFQVTAFRTAPGQFACIFADVTDQRRAEEALRASEHKYRSYIDHAPDAVFVIDRTGRYLDLNLAACTITGYTREQFLGMSLSDITPDESKPDLQYFLSQLTLDGAAGNELRYRHSDGSIRWWTVDCVRIEEGRFLGFARDITGRKKADDDLVYLSYHDQMTGVYNRRFFEEELRRLDKPRNLPLSLVMGDINGLKLINDSFGHSAGDELLIKAASCIHRACRSDDIIARLGGDEFVIILPQTGEHDARKVIQRIRSFSSKETVADVELSVSFGCGTKTKEDTPIADVLTYAENSMYRNKLYEHTSVKSKTVDIIMKALFAKSEREMLHSDRVSQICRDIAQSLNLDRDAVDRIRLAGLMHDIGKIGIAEKVLNKKEHLDANEWEEMKKHPETGWRILSSTEEFSELAGYVFEHQERWDGTGYPRGLKGKNISIEARIIAIADAYDAMTRDRIYRHAMNREEVIRELTRCSGTQFDPDIVRVFIRDVLPVYNTGGRNP